MLYLSHKLEFHFLWSPYKIRHANKLLSYNVKYGYYFVFENSHITKIIYKERHLQEYSVINNMKVGTKRNSHI